LYWPPSERTTKKISEIMKAYEAGEIDDPRPLKFTEIEGTDLNAVFEPIWRGPFKALCPGLRTAAPAHLLALIHPPS
jgi:hypothetical protein